MQREGFMNTTQTTCLTLKEGNGYYTSISLPTIEPTEDVLNYSLTRYPKHTNGVRNVRDGYADGVSFGMTEKEIMVGVTSANEKKMTVNHFEEEGKEIEHDHRLSQYIPRSTCCNGDCGAPLSKLINSIINQEVM